MRTPLAQALHDAQSVSEWMDDNHAADDSVGFAEAWAGIQSVIQFLSARRLIEVEENLYARLDEYHAR